MGHTFPPVAERTAALLKRELSLCAPSQREDAVNEAWVAHLEGRSVVQAVNTFRKREEKYASREVQCDRALALAESDMR